MMTFDNLQELIDLLDESPGITEISIGSPGGEQITIKRPATFSAPPVFIGEHPNLELSTVSSSSASAETEDSEYASPISADSSIVHHPISANRVGIFHSPKPKLDIGDKVSAGQIVGFIESIKLMNEVRSEFNGILAAKLLDEGTPVEYGQQIYSVRESVD